MVSTLFSPCLGSRGWNWPLIAPFYYEGIHTSPKKQVSLNDTISYRSRASAVGLDRVKTESESLLIFYMVRSLGFHSPCLLCFISSLLFNCYIRIVTHTEAWQSWYLSDCVSHLNTEDSPTSLDFYKPLWWGQTTEDGHRAHSGRWVCSASNLVSPVPQT